MTTNKKKWKKFIEGVEQLMHETEDADHKEAMRRSIRLFRNMMEHDEPWPGDYRRRKRRTKKKS